MAHNLEIRDGKASFVAKGEVAWHGLGAYVENAMTAAEVIELANMNWQVEKRPIFIEDVPVKYEGEEDAEFEGSVSEVPGFEAVVRTDTNAVLGVVSPNYCPVQNNECFEFFDSIIDRGEAIYETAGVLGIGERIFLTAKLPTDIEVRGDIDVVNNYILLTNSHDGTNSLRAGFTSIRVVCNNTLTAALSNLGNSIKLRHTTNIRQMLSEAAEIMGISSKYTAELNGIFNKMAKVKISDAKLVEFIEQAMSPKKEQLTKEEREAFSKQFLNTSLDIFNFAKEDSTQQSKAARGTVWGAYNAISGYFGHIADYKSETQRMNTIMFGRGADKVQKAFELATALI